MNYYENFWVCVFYYLLCFSEQASFFHVELFVLVIQFLLLFRQFASLSIRVAWFVIRHAVLYIVYVVKYYKLFAINFLKIESIELYPFIYD